MPELRRTMPTRDPKRAESEPQHSRGYSERDGGYTTPAPQQPGNPLRRTGR